jgi:predicted phage terminase large subunit-like protein
MTRSGARRARRDIGSAAFESQYQQRPQPVGGTVFNKRYFRYFRESWARGSLTYILQNERGQDVRRFAAEDCWLAQTADTALETKAENDWTVVETWAVTPEHDMLLRRVDREKVEVPDQWAYLCACRGAYPDLMWQGVERKASGHGLIQEAARTNLPLKALEPGARDKVVRAMPLAIKYENGQVYHLAGAPWLGLFEHEMLAFPKGKHDDQVDPAAYMAQELTTTREVGLVLL